MRKLFMLIMVVALMALPAMAQEWQSTSVMQGSGSAYSAQVTAVGATDVTDMATTTTSTPNNGPRRAKKDENDGWVTGTDDGGTDLSPIGDAVLPLLLLACAYLGMRVFLKRKRALKS
jgi:hypothetical protein